MQTETKLGNSRIALAACMLAGAVLTQNADAAGRHPRVHEVNARYENQQDRIAQGVKSGQLNSRESARLELRESQLKQQEHLDRVENGGSLTKGQTVQLNHEENRLSGSIYNQKHDAQTETTTPKSEVGKRVENQQDRIAQGINSGHLTARETSRLEARETFLRNQIATDRNANGGKLTDAERAQINGELNQLSTGIYRQKHDP